MAAQGHARGSRGSYALAICLNCRARKIKCVLPDHSVQPSELPQPSTRACERCVHLEIPCIVQPTILGRPAARRKPISHTRLMDSKPVVAAEYQDVSDPDVEQYILSAVDSSIRNETSSAQPTSRDIFDALMSPTALASAVLSHDRIFGAAISCVVAVQRVPLTQLVSVGLAALLDESLVWHRFYLPSTPKVAALRRLLVTSQVSEAERIVAQLLFALLCSLALDVPSNRLGQDQDLRRQLKGVIAQHGEAFVFSAPAHRHSLSILELLINYKPIALLHHQSTAAVAIKAELYIALAYRVAGNIGLERFAGELRAHSDHPEALGDVDIETRIVDSLRWCSILTLNVFANGYLTKPVALMARVLSQIQPVVESVQTLLPASEFRPSTIYLFHRAKCFTVDVSFIVEAKRRWRDLDRLSDIITSHEGSCQCHQVLVDSLMSKLAADNDVFKGQAEIVRSLVDLDLRHSRAKVAGATIFLGLMSRISPNQSMGDLEPDDIVHFNDQVTNMLKDLQIGEGLQLIEFLTRFGGANFINFEHILQSFVDVARDLSMDGVPFFPPPRSAALDILSWCRQIVENNAARKRGGIGLSPTVKRQLELFESCAQRLEAMGASSTGNIKDAFANGCLFAASARLIRCLHDIVVRWKSAEPAAADVSAAVSTQSDVSEAMYTPASFDSASYLDFDALWKEWENWPQAEGMDFSFDTAGPS